MRSCPRSGLWTTVRSNLRHGMRRSLLNCLRCGLPGGLRSSSRKSPWSGVRHCWRSRLWGSARSSLRRGLRSGLRNNELSWKLGEQLRRMLSRRQSSQPRHRLSQQDRRRRTRILICLLSGSLRTMNPVTTVGPLRPATAIARARFSPRASARLWSAALATSRRGQSSVRSVLRCSLQPRRPRRSLSRGDLADHGDLQHGPRSIVHRSQRCSLRSS